MNDVHIITVSTDSKYYFLYLKESCRRNGKQLEVIGYGETWEGFNWKYKKMIDYLKHIKSTDIVCFVDGHDVICTRNLRELKDEFINVKNRTGCKMIVGSENRISYFNQFITSLYFSNCNNLHLCSGTYIAYANDMLEILTKIYNMNPVDDADDQILMTNYCKKFSNEIYIDVDNEIFLTLTSSMNDIGKHVYYKNNKLYYNNKNPFFLHAPSFSILDSIIVKLGYDKSCNVSNQLMKKGVDKFFVYSYACKYIIIICVLLIVLMVCLIYNKKKVFKMYRKIIK